MAKISKVKIHYETDHILITTGKTILLIHYKRTYIQKNGRPVFLVSSFFPKEAFLFVVIEKFV